MAFQKKQNRRKKRRRGKRSSVKNRCRFTPKGKSSPTREDLVPIDYKNVDLLLKFTTSQGKLYSRKRSSNSAKAQNRLKRQIKLARYMALLPYIGD